MGEEEAEGEDGAEEGGGEDEVTEPDEFAMIEFSGPRLV